MDDFTATMIALGDCEKAGIDEHKLTKKQVTDAWQYLIDTGLAWKLEGSFGRTAEFLIEQGLNKRG